MKRILPLLVLCIVSSSSVFGQKKSELLTKIEVLKFERDSVKALVADAERNERLSTARAKSLQSQVTELQDANASLLKNLNSFATVSTKNSENVNLAMASLQVKEAQLKGINDAIAKNDSTAIVVLTNAKQALGEDAKIGVSNGAVLISTDLTSLFGSDSETTISTEAEPWIQQIGQILKLNPEMAVTIEGLSMTGDLNLPAQQSAAVGSALQKLEIDPDRITTLGKDGNLKEGIVIKIHPKYDDFYMMVKENMKNGN
ncbi:hypothetical protein FGM00_07910 [Aggregatimonas sangjinii]|uniref:Uncharacterized protein n=1 Tax=Aggregatimonas sangjinii TaxID=2583587 RepID=A0A5B7SSP5_9FLAO|nr:hypothetical protein [Aggregatimonas sangjinii]QCX00028.1 hypothetical protein FGM00_07910 [Aggregatimonas sangjinii]